MKIVHITTGYNHGGAAIACKRLVVAQREAGIDARVITQEKGDFNDYVISTTKTSFKKKLNFIRHAWEKFIFLFYEKSSLVRFQFSLGNSGESISHIDILKDADIVHFHWTNAGFVSLKEMKKILKLDKTIVWTLHDMWAFTGGCHYSGTCCNYKKHCGDCGYLKSPSLNDLSTKIFKNKSQTYLNSSGNFHVITPSNWLGGCAKESSLLKNIPVSVIPNAVSEIKIVNDRNKIRQELGLPLDKKLILFGAFNLDHERKGSSYLKEALSQISEDSDFNLLVFGKKSELFIELRFKTHFMGYSSDEEYIRKIYACADLYVNPSIEDNLPNTVLESLSVGTPVVAFNMGGMPDMIDHQKNGYLAEYRNSKDLAEGILWCFKNIEASRKNALAKISTNFSYKVIGNKFLEYYTKIKTASLEEYLKGEKLIGDDYTLEQIEQWYEDEKEASFHLVDAERVIDEMSYSFHNLNRKYLFKYLMRLEFKNVLGVGSSSGSEFLSIKDKISRLFIIESSEAFKSIKIGGIVPEFKSPSIDGSIDFSDNTFDLITCFNVLHHIANVSYVMSELHRVLAPNGIFLLREPINSMGDWRNPRPGLTRRERGIPHKLFRKMINECGFEVIKESYCFTATSFLQRLLGSMLKKPIFSYNFYLNFDSFLSGLFKWNIHYHPTKKAHRIAPQLVCYVLKKKQLTKKVI